MSSSNRSAHEPQHILVVCTSEMVLCGLTGMLASAGYGVTGYPDAWRARKVADSRRFALAILDLPPDTGAARELVRFLRQSEPPIKLLALADRTNTSPLEVDEVALRPLLVPDLLKRVARLIGPPPDPLDPAGGKHEAA